MRILIVLLFTTLCMYGRCSAQPLNVTLKSEKGERFTLYLNGEKINKIPSVHVSLDQVEAPFYKIKILFANGKIKPLQKTLTLDPATHTYYVIRKAGHSYKIVLTGATVLPEIKKTGPTQIAADTLTGKGTVQIDPSPKVKTAFIPGYMGQIGCPRPINAQEFNTIRKTILSKNLEEDKQKVARQIINNNCFLVLQVKELLMLFAFEKTRIELAKLTFNHTYDIGNYSKVAEAFVFETSANDLNAFLKEPNKH